MERFSAWVADMALGQAELYRQAGDVDAAAAVLGRALETHSGEPQPRRDARPVRESEPAMADGALGLARSAS